MCHLPQSIYTVCAHHKQAIAKCPRAAGSGSICESAATTITYMLGWCPDCTLHYAATTDVNTVKTITNYWAYKGHLDTSRVPHYALRDDNPPSVISVPGRRAEELALIAAAERARDSKAQRQQQQQRQQRYWSAGWVAATRPESVVLRDVRDNVSNIREATLEWARAQQEGSGRRAEARFIREVAR